MNATPARAKNVSNPFGKRYVGALADRPVPRCPRCGHVTYGWPPDTVGLTYAVCSRCGKMFCR